MRRFCLFIGFLTCGFCFGQNEGSSSEGVGINVLNPETSFDVKGSIKLEHSSQGVDKVLVANADGEVRWGAPFVLNFINGILPVSSEGGNFTDTSSHYTKAKIVLDPGSYLVRGVFLIHNLERLALNQSYYLRVFLSDSEQSPLLTDDYLSYSAKVMSGTLIGPNKFGLIDGNLAIRNATDAPKTYYLWVDLEEYETPTNTSQKAAINIEKFASSHWGENIFYAIPIE